jgi:GT2 family glycosyltransferase
MNYLVGLAYVNRPDLLRTAVRSIQPFWTRTVVIDNSEHYDLRKDDFIRSAVEVYEPPVPLTFTQTMNLMQRKAMEQGCDVVLFMHNDGEAESEVPERLLAFLEELEESGRNWGVVFTHYDVLVAFRMKAIKVVGPWDTKLPQYFADNDYYRRVRLAGFETVDTGLQVHHHNASSTLQSDPIRKHINGITFPLYEKYYKTKWGEL